jgi:hypothetical protein
MPGKKVTHQEHIGYPPLVSRGSNPTRPSVPHGGTPAVLCPLPSRVDALFSEQGPGIVVVVSSVPPLLSG